jgi:hypothetical protein
MNYGFDQNKFFVEYSCSRSVGNIRQEFDRRALDLYKQYPNIILSMSSGLDSQATFHSFYSQGIIIDTAFFYYKNYNDIEYEQLEIISKKYNIKPIIVEIDVDKIKKEILQETEKTGIPPLHLIHNYGLKQLPNNYNFLQGFNGPDFLVRNNKKYILESFNSVEISRLRALNLNERTGKILAFDRSGEILLSLLQDDIIKSFYISYDYFSNNKLYHKNTGKIYPVEFWDLYVKPMVYGKYWKNELEYFPKYQGPENIEWIFNGEKHDYEKYLVAINYDELCDHLIKSDGTKKRFYQYSG